MDTRNAIDLKVVFERRKEIRAQIRWIELENRRNPDRFSHLIQVLQKELRACSDN
jgi:hypothetical protein